MARKDYAGAAAARAEMEQRRSATGHEKRDEKQHMGEKNEREREAKAELQARTDTLGVSAGQARGEDAATGQAGALASQDAKCVQEIEQCPTRKVEPSVVWPMGHGRRDEKPIDGEKSELGQEVEEEEYAREIYELLAESKAAREP